MNYQALVSMENLFCAWEAFRVGKQYRRDVVLFERHLEDNLFGLHEELSTQSYRHRPYEMFHVWDPKFRVIHKAVVRDRMVHHVVFSFLEQLFAKTFIHQSYSCQKRKGIHRAVRDLDAGIRKISKNYVLPVWSLKMDIKKFFDSIDHETLLRLLRQRVEDTQVFWLLETIIRSYSSQCGEGKGVPIGNLTSQIFANIYLAELDSFVKDDLRERWYFRYADDFLLLRQNKTDLEIIQQKMTDFVSGELLVTVHPNKISYRKLSQGIDFVGYVFLPYHRILRTKTKRRIFKKLQKRIEEYHTGAITEVSLYQSVQSYLGMLKHCNGYRLRQQILDEVWLRKMIFVESDYAIMAP